MPKVKWGGQQLQEALENYDHDRDEQYRPYDGPKPPSGMYKWRITRMVSGESTNGFPQLKVYLSLVPRNSADRKFKNFRMVDFIIVKDDGSTDFRIAPLLYALGISMRDFVNNTQADAEGLITRIGTRNFVNEETYVLGSIRPQRNNPEYTEIKYWADSDTAGDDADYDDEPEPEGDDTEAEGDDEPEEAPAPTARKAGGRRTGTQKTPF